MDADLGSQAIHRLHESTPMWARDDEEGPQKRQLTSSVEGEVEHLVSSQCNVWIAWNIVNVIKKGEETNMDYIFI